MRNIIEVDGIEVRYSQAILAVRDISFSVPEGGFVALIGANGAGKTTILRAISRLVQLDRGRSHGAASVSTARIPQNNSPMPLSPAASRRCWRGGAAFSR